MEIQVTTNEVDLNVIPGGLTWLFIGQPKTWKTSAASKWSEKGTKGVLIIDTDLGADFVPDANVVTVTSLNPPFRAKMIDGKVLVKDGAEQYEIVPPVERGMFYRSGPQKGKPMPVYALSEVINWLKKNWTALPYDTIVLDTLDEVNTWIEQIVTEELNIGSMGEADWGADWGRARKRNLDVVKRLQKLIKKYAANLILVSHAKQSIVTDDKVQLLPDVPRGLAYSLAAKADIIGYTTVGKADGKAYISFQSYDERAVGSRLRALAQKKLPFDYKSVREEITQYKEMK